MDFDGLPADPEALYEFASDHDIGDGLPLRSPTVERVDRALERTQRHPDEVLLQVPTSFEPLTLRDLARVAIMAGCRPAYLPVLVAAADAMASWDNLASVMGTTEGTPVALLVSGPAVDTLEINAGQGVFGPGYRANATIGRAVSLMFSIVGGVYPGSGTMATQSHQGRYTFCFGENASPTDWDPFHVDHAGLAETASAVTVMTAHAPLPLSEGNDQRPTAEAIISALAAAGDSAHATRGHPGELTFALSEDHASRLAETYDRHEIQQLLHERCRRPDGERLLPTPDHALVVPAGGAGNYSSAIFAMNAADCPATTERIHT